MGVMKPLLAKLTTLMGDEYKKLKGVRNQVSFLKDELTTMSAFLEKLAFMDDDGGELDPLVKDWRNHLGGGADASGFLQKTARRLKTLRVRHQIANQIDEIKARVIEVNQRRKRYELDGCSNSRASDPAVVDPRLTSLYQKADNLVGIDGPTEELIQLLTDAGQQKLMVVSIVGFGGLGKTTLAKQVYDKIGQQFDCKAFVSVSQRPDIARLLSTIQSKLNIQESSQAHEVQDIIDGIRYYLGNKRYLIVVDDLWKREAWDIISCAFPENANGSRVIVTTRVEDVACWACSNHQYIHRMKPLNSEDSKRLFFKRVIRSKDGCPSQYEEVSAEILKKCGGLPLAIITIASLLACEQARIMQEWESIRNSLGTPFGTNPSLEGMRQILNLSYKNLPLHLRTCLLYLAKYPEDSSIDRDDVVRQWIAEGFVRSSPGQDLEDVGKSYFNELINRGLIQPEQNNYGVVMGCRVHDMMLDLILSRCKEDNFISVAYSCEEYMLIAGQHGYNYNKVHRLSVQSMDSESDCTILMEGGVIPARLAHVRSVSLFGKHPRELPLLLPLFKYLRVLHITFYLLDQADLTAIRHLVQLGYLLFVSHCFKVELPSRICGLVHLETLEIVAYHAVSFPSDIVSLACLSHLRLPRGGLPNGIPKIKSLRTLEMFHPPDMDIEALGELTNLRKLSLFFDLEATMGTASNLNALGSSIGKLQNLRYLEFTVPTVRFDDDGLLGSLSAFPCSIEILKPETWRFSRIPTWINADLCHLHLLELLVSETCTDEVGVVGELPSLIHLHLQVELKMKGTVVFGASGAAGLPGRCNAQAPDARCTIRTL
uniref:NBS-LRR-like resistance protein n=1 Tax=Oryza sativa TaxID=4530 RepID=A0A0U2S1V3_ORYSA|nr:NBS-LRR-like resistance protein [Oryza sativa]